MDRTHFPSAGYSIVTPKHSDVRNKHFIFILEDEGPCGTKDFGRGFPFPLAMWVSENLLDYFKIPDPPDPLLSPLACLTLV